MVGRGSRVLGRGVCWEEESGGKRIESVKRGSSVRKKIESGGKGTFGKRIECWEEYRVCWEEARTTHSVPARRDLQPSLSSGPTWPAVRLLFFISTSSASITSRPVQCQPNITSKCQPNITSSASLTSRSVPAFPKLFKFLCLPEHSRVFLSPC